MDLVHKPFPSVFRAIAYFVYNNPARQKQLNIFETERTQKRTGEEFSGDNSRDIWASVCCAIRDTLAEHPPHFRHCFEMYYLDAERRFSKEVIADELNLPRDIVRKKINQILEDLETEMFHRRLIEMILS